MPTAETEPAQPDRRSLLILASIGLIVAMWVLVPWLTERLGPSRGFFVIFCLYWFAFCLPLGLAFQGVRKARAHLSYDLAGNGWVPWVVALQTGIVAVGSWLLLPDHVPLLVIPIALFCGLINGFSEEFFWRGAYLAQGRGLRWFQITGVVLFTLWHVPLVFAHGIVYEGGPMALIGGAGVLGILWSIIANRTGCIGWTIVSHMLTNMAVFIGFFTTNFVP